MNFLSGINLVGAVLGFVIGVFGFIIVRYWIRPVSAYVRLKRRVADAVEAHLSIMPADAGSDDAAGVKESRMRLRKLSQELTDTFHHDLPHWYRIRLRARGELPPEAAADLMKLSGAKQVAPARKGAVKIQKHLRIERLENELARAPRDRQAGIEEKLRVVRAERKRMRDALDGQKDRSR